MAKDCLGIEVKIGDVIAYGSSQGDSKSGFRIGIVTDTEKPTVQPFRRNYYGEDAPATWDALQKFGFPKVKGGDFIIININPENIEDEKLKKLFIAAKTGKLDDILFTTCSNCKKKIRKDYWNKDKNGDPVHWGCNHG